MSKQLANMCFITPELLQCINKLTIDIRDRGNEEYELNIDWDKDDETLRPWMDLSEEDQTEFILACLNSQAILEGEEVAQVVD